MNILRVYEERFCEVNDYLQLLKFFDDLSTRIPWSGTKFDDNTSISYQPHRDMQKILRADTYVLLYNLVEATFAMMVEHVKTTINDEKKPLLNFIPEIRKVCSESCFKSIDEVIDFIDKGKPVYIDNWKISYSGNVTIHTIKSFFASIKCSPKTTLAEQKVEISLDNIKTTRNRLGHGEVSFAQEGANKPYDEVCRDFETSTFYLREMLKNLDDYVKNKKYLV